MKKHNGYYGSLLARFFDNKLEAHELGELLDWMRDYPDDYYEILHSPEKQRQLERYSQSTSIPDQLSAEMFLRLKEAVAERAQLKDNIQGTDAPLSVDHPSPAPTSFLKIIWRKRSWLGYAAVFILIPGTWAYFVYSKQRPELVHREIKTAPVKQDILPGGNKATLTLADGSIIILDSAAIGNLARQGASTVEKSADGQITYGVSSAAAMQPVVFNTMSTPKGGQYGLALPDGSRVWLNSASSITYPTQFIGTERVVNMTGEAYFEVVSNAAQPFTVKTHMDEITVTGTLFNVNSYTDEPAMKTSLLEGSIRIGNKILKPGQAYRNGVVSATDLEQDLAWKNGVFSFDDKTLDVVMRQLSRWYDLEVVYPNGIPQIEFGGELKRGLNLLQILKVLESSEVHFQLEGRRLIVKP